jgi:hypothetical protein
MLIGSFPFALPPLERRGGGGRKTESNLLLASHYFRFSYLVACPFKPVSVILAATEPFTGQ